ncbi:MAG: tetratricopeptide repeat protein, partial [Terriglobales bacterium]
MARSHAWLIAAALALPLAGQAPPKPVPALAPPAQGYTEFELGKWAELQAETHNSGAYVQQALQHYGAAMAADPKSAYIAAQMADFLSRMGRAADATTLAQTVVKAHQESIIAHQTLGRIYLRELSQQRQPLTGATVAAAVAEYKALIQLDPGSASNIVVLGKLYGAEAEPGLAEQQFRAALAAAPTNMDALSSLVQALASQDRLDEAEKEIAGLPAVARSGQVYATLGDAYIGRRRFPQAAAAYRQAAEAEPDEPAFASAMAKALMEGGDFAAALSAYKKVRAQAPDDGDVALRLGQLQMQMGDFPGAAANLQAAQSLLGPDNLEVAYAQALLDQSQGRDQLALGKLRALAARKTAAPTQSIFLAQLAQLEARNGDPASADADLKQLEALGPTYRARAQSLAIELYGGEHDYPRALAAAKRALADDPGSRTL